MSVYFVSKTLVIIVVIFFFNDTATTEIYTLSLHDALPISVDQRAAVERVLPAIRAGRHLTLLVEGTTASGKTAVRSEEHTSELQSRQYLVCRLLLEKKKTKQTTQRHMITHIK